jgi:Uma2 family endonuclease
MTPAIEKTVEQTSIHSFIPNEWQLASWETFTAIADHPDYAKAKCYYFESRMRVETMGVGPNHAVDNTLLILAIGLFCMTRGINNRGLTNASYQKQNYSEAQPDVSYYLGTAVQQIPDNNTVIDLNRYLAPDLVIEIAATSLNEDLGTKRLLYQALGIKEYWVFNVEKAEISAFQILDIEKSEPIRESIVLPGLELSLLEEALRSRTTCDDSQIMAQLLTQFQSN